MALSQIASPAEELGRSGRLAKTAIAAAHSLVAAQRAVQTSTCRGWVLTRDGSQIVCYFVRVAPVHTHPAPYPTLIETRSDLLWRRGILVEVRTKVELQLA